MIISVRVLVILAALLAIASARAEDPVTLNVWPDGAPGEKPGIGDETVQSPRDKTSPVTRITNVTVPTLALFPAPAEKANGCGVVICPGGGYSILAYDKEGTEVAKWLNSLGVTAVVLKYRVPRRDKDHPHIAPLQDAQRAMRLVRKNAESWGIDPARLGMLGFSAGGHLTVMTGTHWDESAYEKIDAVDDMSSRPDFLIPIYAAYLGDKDDQTKLDSLVRITDRTPPTFMAVTYDDKMRAVHAALLLIELKKAGVPCELHIYSKGGHGYGLRPSDKPVSTWHRRCEDWMRLSGLLAEPKK